LQCSDGPIPVGQDQASRDNKDRTDEIERAQYATWEGSGCYQGGDPAHVKVELASGLTVMSSIINEAVDDLALKIGDSVSAVIKSSDVMIGK
jgi:molybdopterin-binding protein